MSRLGAKLFLALAVLLPAALVRADNPITRGTPLQMTNIILALSRSVAWIDFGAGVVTQLNTGYGLVGGPITNGGTIAVDSNVIGTVVRVDSGAGLLGGPVTRSGTLYLDTNYVPWVEAGTNVAVVRTGRTNTVHGTIYGTLLTNVMWTVVTNVTHTTWFPETAVADSNGVVLSYTAPADGLYRLEYAVTFNNTNHANTTFDGRWIGAVRWSDVSGMANADVITDMPFYQDVSEQNFGDNQYTNWWHGGTFMLNALSGTAIQVSNYVVISWSAGDMSGPHTFRAALSRLKTNVFLGREF